jgi:hypothetical protein
MPPTKSLNFGRIDTLVFQTEVLVVAIALGEKSKPVTSSPYLANNNASCPRPQPITATLPKVSADDSSKFANGGAACPISHLSDFS